MNKRTYSYKYPIKYLISIVSFGLPAFIFTVVVLSEWKLSYLFFVCSFFALLTFSAGFAFLLLFLKNIKSKYVELTDTYIKIPDRWTKKSFQIKYADIVHIELVERYDKIIEIYTKVTIYIIEHNWMRNENEFLQLFEDCKRHIENAGC